MNKEFKRMIELAGLTEIKINIPGDLSSPGTFQRFMDSIPNEKYFYVFPDGEDITDDDYDIADDVDLLQLDIFDNELKGRPGIEGDGVYEFRDIDKEKNPDPYGNGLRETILVDKVLDIIKSYNPEYSKEFY